MQDIRGLQGHYRGSLKTLLRLFLRVGQPRSCMPKVEEEVEGVKSNREVKVHQREGFLMHSDPISDMAHTQK